MDATLQPVACPSEHSSARPIWYGVDGAWSRGASLRIPRVASWRPGVHPPPHQPSPFGSASATPPRGGSDTRGTNRGRRLHIRPGTWFTSCQAIGQAALCRPQESLPPGGGVGERAQPAVEPEGGNSGLALLVHPSGKRDFFPSGGAWCWESNLAEATWTAPPDRPNGRICRV